VGASTPVALPVSPKPHTPRSTPRTHLIHPTHDPPPGEEAVKRAYLNLLHSWVRPIVHDPEAERQKKLRQVSKNLHQRKLAMQRSKEEMEALQRKRDAESALQPGQKGFRRHAYIPLAAKLDYVHNPGSALGAAGGRRRGEEDEDEDGGFGAMAAVAPEPGARRGGGGGGGGGAEMNPLDRKMIERNRQKKGSTARAATVSVEGRNIGM